MPESFPPPTPGEPIAVVGMACRFPDAVDLAQFLELFLTGRRAFRRLPPSRLAGAGEETRRPAEPVAGVRPRGHDAGSHDAGGSEPDGAGAGESAVGSSAHLALPASGPGLPDPVRAAVIEGWRFDRAAFGVSEAAYRAADPAHWLALETAARALADAGLPGGQGLSRDRTGVVIGNTLTGEVSRAGAMRYRWPYVRRVLSTALAAGEVPAQARADVMEHAAASFLAPFPEFRPDSLAGSLPSAIADRICGHFGFRGGGHAVDSAHSSSLLAVAAACSALAAGDLDSAVAGGVDISLDPFELAGLTQAGVLAEQEMRVFDARPTGFWPGEGCGLVVLMRARDARAANVPVYAEIAGWGVSSAGSPALTRPGSGSLLLALRRAYQRALIDPGDIQLIEGDGTGTASGDLAELTSLAEIRAGAPGLAALGSVKANIGHAKAAAGVAGLIKATLAVAAGVIPPTSGCVRPHSLISTGDARVRVPRAAEPWPEGTRLAGVSAVGPGGTSVHLVLRRDTQGGRRRRAPVAGRTHQDSLTRPRRDGESRVIALTGTPRTEAFVFSAPDRHALAAELSRVADLGPWLSDGEFHDLACDAARRAEAPGPMRVSLVAGDQAQLSALARDAIPVLSGLRPGRLATSPGIFAADGGRGRVALLFPGEGASLATPTSRALASDPGGNYDPALQPAIVAASLNGLRWLDQLGVVAESGVGHGLGEITGLVWAGCLSEQDAARLVSQRAAVLGSASDPQSALVCVDADAQSAQAMCRGTDLVIAADNGPRCQVLAGPLAAVRDLSSRLAQDGVPARVLDAPSALYSPAMADRIAPLRTILGEFAFRPPSRRLISTITGIALAARDDVATLLCTQLTSPVRFAGPLGQAALDADLLVETGPGDSLSLLAADCCDVPAVSLGGGRADDESSARAMAALFATGAARSLLPMFAGRPARPIDIWRERTFIASPLGTAQPPGLKASATMSGRQRPEPAPPEAATAHPAAAERPTRPAQPARADAPQLRGSASGLRQEHLRPATSRPDKLHASGSPPASAVLPARPDRPAEPPAPATDAARPAAAAVSSTANPDTADADTHAPDTADADTDSPGTHAPATVNSGTVNSGTDHPRAGGADLDPRDAGGPDAAARAGGGVGAPGPVRTAPPSAALAETDPSAEPTPSATRPDPAPRTSAATPAADPGSAADPGAAADPGSATGPGAAPAPAGAAPWVRVFAETSRPVRGPARSQAAGPWRVRPAMRQPFGQMAVDLFADDADADSVLAVLADPAEAGGCATLLGAAKEAVACGRLVVVTSVPGLTGFCASVQAEHPALGVTLIQTPENPAGLRVARMFATATPGRFRELRIDEAGTAHEPVMAATDPSADGPFPLGPADVVLVSGVTSIGDLACTASLASRGAALALIAPPGPEDPRLAAYLGELRASGIRVSRKKADPSDPGQVAAAVRSLERALGPVTAVVHAASPGPIERCARLPEATLRAQVTAQRARLANLLAAIAMERVRLLLTFGSVSARYGRREGSAGALLSGLLPGQASRLASGWPRCRVAHVDWAAWLDPERDGAPSPSPAQPATPAWEVTPIPISNAWRLLHAVLASTGFPARAAIHGRTGATLPGQSGADKPTAAGRFLEKVRLHYPGIELIAETRLSLPSDPYLADHRIDGLLVLPAAIAMEAMAQAAGALAGSPIRHVSDFAASAPVVLPSGADGGEAVIRVCALRRDDEVETVLRCSQTGFRVDHARATFRPGPALIVPAPGAGEPAPADVGAAGIVDGTDLYGPVYFQAGRFRRVAFLPEVSSRSCRALVRGGDDQPWFGALAGPADVPLILGSPGLNDATLHVLQACVPHRRVLPAGCESVTFSGLEVRGALQVHAERRSSSPREAGEEPGGAEPARTEPAGAEPARSEERAGRRVGGRHARPAPDDAGPAGLPAEPAAAPATARPGLLPHGLRAGRGSRPPGDLDHDVWDVRAVDATGRPVSVWSGVRLQDVGPLARQAPWHPALLAVCLECRAAEFGLDPALRAVVSSAPSPVEAAPRADSASRGGASSTRDGGVSGLRWPDAPAREREPRDGLWRAAAPGRGPLDGFELSVQAGRPVACAWEAVGPEDQSTGADPALARLRQQLSDSSHEPAPAVDARLRAIAACLARLDREPGTALSLDDACDGGWIVVRAAGATAACAVVDVSGVPAPVAVAIATRLTDSGTDAGTLTRPGGKGPLSAR